MSLHIRPNMWYSNYKNTDVDNVPWNMRAADSADGLQFVHQLNVCADGLLWAERCFGCAHLVGSATHIYDLEMEGNTRPAGYRAKLGGLKTHGGISN